MEKEIEVRKIEVEPRRTIPAIAVTAIAMVVALVAIIVLQKVVNAPATPPAPSVQTPP